MRDIENRKDIENLVDNFYKLVIKDELIGSFFTKVVVLDWEKHIPVMYNFWETIVLGNITYKGNPMLKHISLSQKKAIKEEHFDRWLKLWESTLSQYFQGPKANEALNRAQQIAELMKFKIKQHAQSS